jgi:uncharacterized protein involved in propanediol utilization
MRRRHRNRDRGNFKKEVEARCTVGEVRQFQEKAAIIGNIGRARKAAPVSALRAKTEGEIV